MSAEALKKEDIPHMHEQNPKELDIVQLMAEIREQVKREIAKGGTTAPQYKPVTADSDGSGQYRAGHLLNSEELRFLNRSYTFGHFDPGAIQSHRFGPIGKLIIKLKRKFLSWLWHNLMNDYVSREREFQSHLVRYLNESSRYIDARDSSIFWELVRKVDVEVDTFATHVATMQDEQMGTIRSAEKRISDELRAGLGEFNRSEGEIREKISQHDAQVKTLDNVTRGLESILAKLKTSRGSSAVKAGDVNTAGGEQVDVPDYSYLLLENRFRGSEDEIASRLAIYPEIFKRYDRGEKPILEIGPGRGELLSLFKESGIRAYGIDIDEAMVAASKEKGLAAEVGDAIAHLASCDVESLSGVIAVQVVEHLTSKQLRELFELCATKVAPGGKIVFETINPQSLLALSSNYFRDPTHVWPLHPDTLRYAMDLAGIKNCEVQYLSPIDKEAQLKPLPVEEHLTPKWAFTIKRLNHNFDRLNNLLYGYQDYCIIGEV